MQINIYKALWGMEGTYEEQFKRIAEAGYKGIEASLPASQVERIECAKGVPNIRIAMASGLLGIGKRICAIIIWSKRMIREKASRRMIYSDA